MDRSQIPRRIISPPPTPTSHPWVSCGPRRNLLQYRHALNEVAEHIPRRLRATLLVKGGLEGQLNPVEALKLRLDFSMVFPQSAQVEASFDGQCSIALEVFLSHYADCLSKKRVAEFATLGLLAGLLAAERSALNQPPWRALREG